MRKNELAKKANEKSTYERFQAVCGISHSHLRGALSALTGRVMEAYLLKESPDRLWNSTDEGSITSTDRKRCECPLGAQLRPAAPTAMGVYQTPSRSPKRRSFGRLFSDSLSTSTILA